MTEQSHLMISRFGEFEIAPSMQYDTNPCLLERPSVIPTIDGVILEFTGDSPEEITMMSKSGSGTIIIHQRDLRKLPHELVSYYLLGGSDRSFESVLGRSNTKRDKRTPDYLHKHEGKLYCAELKTSTSKKTIERNFTNAIETYYDDLKSTELPIFLGGISINFNSIVTNLKFSDVEMNYACSLFALGHSILNAAIFQGLLIEEDEPVLAEIREQISKSTLPEDSDDPLIITKELVEIWSTHNPNDQECLDYYKKCLLKDRPKNPTRSLPSQDYETRSDQKAIVQYPMVIPKVGKMNLQDFYEDLTLGDSLNGVWIEALKTVSSRSEEFEIVTAKTAYDTDKLTRGKRYKLEIDLSEEDSQSLAVFGVKGKRNYSIKKEMKEVESRKPFDYSVNTSDVEEFINSKRMFQSHIFPTQNEDRMCYETLLNQGIAKEDFIMHFKNTKLESCCKFLSLVMEEVNFSRSVNTKRNEFICKLFPDHQAALLISPTKLSDKIFFSLAVCAEDVFELPFKAPREVGRFHIYDFLSVDQHKISNILGADLKVCSIFLSTAVSMFDSYKFDFGNESFLQHSLFLTLVYLEDKESVAADLSLARYAYMSLMQDTTFEKPDPMKIVSKLCATPRSRLLVHIHRNYFKTFSKMAEDPPKIFKTTDDVSRDSFVGLLSWVTGTPVKSLQSALHLSYMAQVHNKNEGSRYHGNFKIFDKIINQELKLRNARVECMRTESLYEELRSHEFNLNYVICAIESLKRQLATVKSIEEIEAEALISLSAKSIFEFATTKASFMTSESDEYRINGRYNVNIKCMEAVDSVIKEMDLSDERVFLNLHKIISFVECKQLRSNLFKKLQLTGPREIFILDIFSRIVINFLESISRSICSYVPGEMLTKGSEKLKTSDNHTNEVASKSSGRFVFSTTDAADAATWCQQFVMTMFGVMTTRLLSEDLNSCVCRILNLVTNKKLELPKSLLDAFVKNPNIRSMSDNMNELKDQFLGLKDQNDLIEKGTVVLKNRSNMMQGILHYTSSLMHSAVLNYAGVLFKTVLKRLFPEAVLVITDKVSSDDSETMKSIIYQNEDLLPWIKRLCYLHCKAMPDLYNLTCMRDSYEKSTRFMNNGVSEFNSTWKIVNTLVGVSIKFIWACLRLPFGGCLESRLNTMSNARKNLLENGCGTKVASIVQQLQMEYYYLMLGSRSQSSAWTWFCNIRSTKSSKLGYFVLESTKTCGLFGLEYANYILMRDNDSLKRLDFAITQKYDLENVLLSEEKFRLEVSFGQSRKFREMKDRLGHSFEDLEEKLIEDCSPIFKTAKSKDDLLLKYNYMSSNRQIANSFMFDCEARLHSISAYILAGPSLVVKNGEEFEKLSMIEVVCRLRSVGEPPKDYLKLRYQNHFFWDMVEEEEQKLKPQIIPSPRTKYKLTKFPIPKSLNFIPITMSKILKRFWFGLDIYTSDLVYDKSLSDLLILHPWIRSNPIDTLSNSIYTSMIDLMNFCRMEEKRSTLVTVMSSSKSTLTVRDGINELISHSVCRGFRYNKEFSAKPDDRMKRSMEVIDSIRLFSTQLSTSYCREKGRLLKNFILAKGPVFHTAAAYGIAKDDLSIDDQIIGIMTSSMLVNNLDPLSLIRKIKPDFGFIWIRDQMKIDGEFQRSGSAMLEDGDIKILAEIDNNNRLKFSSVSDDLRNYTKQMRNFINSLHKVKPISLRSNLYITKFGNLTFTPGDESYPIFHVSKVNWTSEGKKSRCVVENDHLNLIVGETVIMRVYPNSRGSLIEKTLEEDTGDEMLNQWINNMTLDIEDFYEFKGRFIVGIQQKIIRERSWVVDTIRQRYKYKFDSVVTDVIRTAKIDSKNQREVIEMEEIDFDDIDTSLKAFIMSEEEAEAEEMEEAAIVEEPEMFLMNETRVLTTAYCKFWDNVIDHMKHSRVSLLNAIVTGRPDNIDDDVQMNIYNSLFE